MDNREAGVKAARQAVALVSIESDANLGPVYLLTLAQVYAHFGDVDQAIPLIGKLLDTLGTGDTISPALLRLDPIWDPIRNDPRFRELLARFESAPNK